LPSVGQLDFDSIGPRTADDVPVSQHVVFTLELDDHSGAGLLDPAAAAVLQAPAAGDVRFDVYHGGADQLDHRFDDSGLGFQDAGVPPEGAVQLRPLLGRQPAATFHRWGSGGLGPGGLWLSRRDRQPQAQPGDRRHGPTES